MEREPFVVQSVSNWQRAGCDFGVFVFSSVRIRDSKNGELISGLLGQLTFDSRSALARHRFALPLQVAHDPSVGRQNIARRVWPPYAHRAWRPC